MGPLQDLRLKVGPEPAQLGRGLCQVDRLGSDATYRRMKKALATASDARKNRTAALREIFLGEAQPDRRRARKLRLFNEALNEFQQDAVKRCRRTAAL